MQYRSVILIVDDNPRNLQVLGKYLKNEGFRVEFALDGMSALHWTDRVNFDLILLDIMMPGMDGFELCSILKKDPEKMKIPVIFLTAKIDTESIIKGFDLGAVDYVLKPFNQKELIARVKTQIEIKKSRDEIANNLNEIKNKNKLITYSIQYAHKIQNAVLKASQNDNCYFKDFFCLSIPKDIVSGDFYWSHKIDNQLLAGVFDCTGHGIPGAFMSILGITLLNETVIIEGIRDPALILNRLREKIISALGQKGHFTEVKDGMDGSIISYNMEDKNIMYSGSYNPMYLIRKDEIIEFKADRMPLSHHERMSGFSHQEMKTKSGDKLYLFTDGYRDQFGGNNKKRIGSTRFKELLLQINKSGFNVQKQNLLDFINAWKGEEDQVDDITIVGLKLS